MPSDLSTLQLVALGAVAVSWLGTALWWVASWVLLRVRRVPPARRWPSVSILKPLAGVDEGLLENLESHVALDYPGEVELLLGVRSRSDAAWPLATEFAAKHPGRVRLVVQEEAPGLNPKVNQLVTLTRHARHELLAVTDSNVRVGRAFLREHAAISTARPEVGLTANCFFGVGERSFGAAMDNLTQASFVATSIAVADVLLRRAQVVSKSMVVSRPALEAVGGWESFKDLLAEDQQLGRSLHAAGYGVVICPTPVHTFQQRQPLGPFWRRHTRWAMIRHRVVRPAVWLEPLLSPTVASLALLASAPTLALAWLLAFASMLFSTIFTAHVATLGRPPFAWRWLLLTPVRDVLLFAAWIAAAFLHTVEWRGNALIVGRRTRLRRPSNATVAALAK